MVTKYKMSKGLLRMVLIVIVAVVVLFAFAYYSKMRYETQKKFFVNSCARTFYINDNLNDMLSEAFDEVIPIELQSYMGGYGGYVKEKSVRRLCGDIYDFYQEDLDEYRSSMQDI